MTEKNKVTLGMSIVLVVAMALVGLFSSFDSSNITVCIDSDNTYNLDSLVVEHTKQDPCFEKSDYKEVELQIDKDADGELMNVEVMLVLNLVKALELECFRKGPLDYELLFNETGRIYGVKVIKVASER